MYTGIDDTSCPVAQAKRVYDELGSEQKTITVLEYKDNDDKEAGRMTHECWALPLSDSVLDRVVNSLNDQATFLTAMGALTAATVLTALI